jgi:hypothetical protein
MKNKPFPMARAVLWGPQAAWKARVPSVAGAHPRSGLHTVDLPNYVRLRAAEPPPIIPQNIVK